MRLSLPLFVPLKTAGLLLAEGSLVYIFSPLVNAVIYRLLGLRAITSRGVSFSSRGSRKLLFVLFWWKMAWMCISFSLIVEFVFTFYLPGCPPLITLFVWFSFRRQSLFIDGLFLKCWKLNRTDFSWKDWDSEPSTAICYPIDWARFFLFLLLSSYL